MPATSERETTAREYAAAREDSGVFELRDRALLVASGPSRQKFLHGLLSNDVADRTPGQGCRAALMDAKGHLLTFVRVSVAENDIVLELPAARREEIERLLNHYRVAAPVRFAAPADVVLGVVGPRVLERLRTLDASVPDLAADAHAAVTIAGTKVRLAQAGDLPRPGYVLHVPADAVTTVETALIEAGLARLGPETVDVLRIEDGRPWYGPDIGTKNLLHETGLVSEYHSPAKGCYVGQEVIARLEARGGNVNQRLLGLRLTEPRPAGTILRAADKDAGTLTTAAVSPRLGPIAIGYVHRSQAEPGTVLDAGGTRAEVAALPFL